MFFKNVTFFLFPPTLSFDELGTLLPEAALKPVGPLELSSRGFVSPFGRGSDVLHRQIGHAIWLTVGGEDKILPGSVVNELLAKKLDAIEKQEGRKVGGRTRKRLKEDLLHELLPKAFVKPSRTDAILNTKLGFLAVNTASRKVAETVASEIRRALGSFPALPLNPEVAPRSVLTGWIAGEPLPDDVTLGETFWLQDAMDGGATVKCDNQEAFSDEVGKHLEAGKQVTRLALNIGEDQSFVLDEKMTVRRYKLLDGAVDSLEETERDDLAAELDARFALQAGELVNLYGTLQAAFHLSAIQ